MSFTKQDLERMKLHIRRNEELIARQVELVRALRREHLQLVVEAEEFLEKLHELGKELRRNLEFIRRELRLQGTLDDTKGE